MGNSELKIGDLVRFSAKKTIPAKTGEIVALYSDETADVYVMAEVKVYRVLISKLRKI